MRHKMDSPCQEEMQNRRQSILDAAYIVFSRNGYHKATVDEIISLADTGKGTVYNYFTNKEQLFYTLIKERSASFEQALAELAGRQEAPLEKIKQAIKLFLLFLQDNGDLWRVMMFEIRGLGNENQAAVSTKEGKKYRKWFTDNIGIMAHIIEEGINAGQFKDCDPSKTAYGLFSVIVMLAFRQAAENIETAGDAVADTFLYGIAKQ